MSTHAHHSPSGARAALGAAALATFTTGLAGHAALVLENGFLRSTEAVENIVAVPRHDAGGGTLQNRVHRVNAEIHVGGLGADGTVVVNIGSLPGIPAIGWQYCGGEVEVFHAGQLPGDGGLAAGSIRLSATLWPGSRGKMRVSQSVSAADGTELSKGAFFVPLLETETPEEWTASVHISGDAAIRIWHETIQQASLFLIR